MKAIIAAAGTAGHINPGLAIANKIMKEDKNSKVIFIGTTRGLENDLVPRAGYELKTIDAYGLSKKISIENLKKMYKTLKGFGEAKKIIKEFKPDIVIGTGGYICGATISAAHSLKIPTLLHESNAFPGKAVKMLANKTDTILVSFEDAIARIKNAKNIVYTGTPVKIEKIYSSADYLLNKRTGNLYKKAEEEIGIPPEKHIHVGDNQYSDIQMAQSLGIETIKTTKTEFDFVPEKNRKFNFDLSIEKKEIKSC